MQRDQLVDRPTFVTTTGADQDAFVRNALWATAVFNVFGAILFGFPDTFGRFSGLPSGVPVVYRAMIALFILLFGAAYAWLARSRVIDRPLLAFGAIGKTGAFLTIFVLWLAAKVPFLAVVTITGDLVFAMIFARWLFATRDAA